MVVREKERWKYSCASLLVVVRRRATSPSSSFSVQPARNTSPSFIFIYYVARSRATIFKKELGKEKKPSFPWQQVSSFRFVQLLVLLGEGSVVLNKNERSVRKAVGCEV